MSREDLEAEMKSNPEFVVGLLRKLAEEMRRQSKVRFSCRGGSRAREPDDPAEAGPYAFFWASQTWGKLLSPTENHHQVLHEERERERERELVSDGLWVPLRRWHAGGASLDEQE